MEKSTGSEFSYSIASLALTLFGYSPTYLLIFYHPTSYPAFNLVDLKESFGVLLGGRECPDKLAGLQQMPQPGECAEI